MSCMSKLVSEDAVIAGQTFKDSTELLEVASDRLIELGLVKPSFKPAIIAREAEFPTGLPVEPVSVAIPHTEREHVISNAVLIVIPKEPVYFDSMEGGEGQAANIVFVLALASDDDQINCLMEVMGIATNQDLLAELVGLDSASEIVERLQCQ